VQLAEAGRIIRSRILKRHMKTVCHNDPDSTYIDEDVEIGIDTVVYPSTIIEGKTK